MYLYALRQRVFLASKNKANTGLDKKLISAVTRTLGLEKERSNF